MPSYKLYETARPAGKQQHTLQRQRHRQGAEARQAELLLIQTFTYPALGKTYAIKEAGTTAGTRNPAGLVKVTGKAMKLRKQ